MNHNAKNLAPILLFVYNRPYHTLRALESLQSNQLSAFSELFIYADGPKDNASERELQSIKEVRKIIKRKWCGKVTIKESSINKGLSASIISEVTDLLHHYEKAIILEDDLLLAPCFLDYMNNSLNLYEQYDEVISIHGYTYPVDGLPETFFLKGADCWGWATWKRGWELFENEGQKLLSIIKAKNLCEEFNYYNSFPFTSMLEHQINGGNDSWAIRWYASAFIHNKLTLHPGTSLVKNIGLDNSGTHCTSNTFYNTDQSLPQYFNIKLTNVVENKEAKRKIAKWFLATNTNQSQGTFNKLKNRILNKVRF